MEENTVCTITNVLETEAEISLMVVVNKQNPINIKALSVTDIKVVEAGFEISTSSGNKVLNTKVQTPSLLTQATRAASEPFLKTMSVVSKYADGTKEENKSLVEKTKLKL